MSDLNWLSAIRRYLLTSLLGHAVWEVLQLPLFTLWLEAPTKQIAFATLHCLGGDLVIATSALIGALVIFGRPGWPQVHALPVALTVLCICISYTAWSEYNNALIKRVWTYTDVMPLLPVIKVGVTPMLQWLVVPILALLASSGSLFKPVDTGVTKEICPACRHLIRESHKDRHYHDVSSEEDA